MKMTPETVLLHELLLASADRCPDRLALTHAAHSLTYSDLASLIAQFHGGLAALGLARGERVGIYLDKRHETVVSAFGTASAGGVFVPLNPLLRPEQVSYILRDCNVRALVTSPERLSLLKPELPGCEDLGHIVLVGDKEAETSIDGRPIYLWSDLLACGQQNPRPALDTDIAAILYTSGSTGRPKGVVLSHRNMVAGAKSVASYLRNHAEDTLLAALPLSFDAGFSQLTTAFHTGARVVLLNYLLPRDVISMIAGERVTGLTAVPPLYIQLSQMQWPQSVIHHLRYFANTGGRMPLETLKRLRSQLPHTQPFLMYGLTEAFRATYLPPEEVSRRPDSIGKAIPNAEILVLHEDGTPCGPNEPGELVQRGALVAQGYWNDPAKTAERFKALPPGVAGRQHGTVLPEFAVFSGDTVRMDEEGFLYFIGRRDEMIKTSGYRVSPTEIEEVLYASGLVAEVAAFGVPHPLLGQAIVVVATTRPDAALDTDALLASCRERLPVYMLPAHIDTRCNPLPRSPNGKIDRKLLATEFERLFELHCEYVQ